MKRILAFLIAVMLIASLAVTASAATTEQDGIKIEMVTDKEEYSKGETITATLTVTNTNEYDATDISLEGVVPSGYKVRNANKLKIATLAAGETKTITVSFVRSMDFLWIILIVVLILLVIAAAVVLGIFLLRRKPKQITAAVLCVAMLLGMASATVSAADNDMALPDDNFTSQGSGETTPPEETTAPTEEEVTPSDINISDDFSTFAPSVGAVPKENGWGVTNAADATQTEDEKLKISQLTFHVPEGITGDYAVEFRYQLPTDVRAKVVLGQGIQTTKSQVYLQFTGGGSKYEDRVNFNKGNVTSNVNYIFNGIEQWHLVQIAVSQTNKTYKMYVDGRQVNFGADIEFAFFNEQITKMTQVVFQCTGGHLQLDDFRIYMGEPEVDEGPVIENPSNYSDNFSNFQAMVSKNAPLKSYWWLTSESNAVQTEDGKVKVKELNYYVPQGISDSYTLEFKYRLPMEGRAYLKIGEGVETSKLQVYMTLSGGDSKYADRIKFMDGKEGVNEIFKVKGQWHTMKLIVDNTRKIYLAYVDGNLVTDEYDFYVPEISTLKRITWQCSAGDLLIDDFKIKPGADKVVFYDYTPTANSNLIYEATFDNWALGEIKGREYRRWKAGGDAANGYTTMIVEEDGNRYMRFSQNQSSYPTANYTLKEPMTKGQYTVEIRVRQEVAVGAMLSLLPASGGFNYAGPDLKFSKGSAYTINDYNMSLKDQDEDGWYVIALCIDMDARTYDVYCDGMMAEEAIPFRNVETSKLDYITIGHCVKDATGDTDVDYLRIYKGKVNTYADKLPVETLEGFERVEATVVANRKPIPSNYSDVNLSTRRVRGGGGEHEGSLDILKQFMVTFDRWVYSNSSDVTHRVTDLGVNMQQSVSPTSFAVRGIDVNCKWYDGTDFYLAWLKGSNHGCVNNPIALAQRLELLKTAVEDGSRSIQNDDPLYNWEFYKTGGCWCTYCVEKFTEFLLENYTTEELKEKAPNVTITKNFNYRQYLEKTYGWVTNNDYTTNRHLDPLEPYYEAFMRATTINYHALVKEYLNNLGYGEIRYSANLKTASMDLSATDAKKNASYYMFTDSMPETNIGIMTRDTLNMAGIIDDALGRTTIFGVIPADGAANLQRLRMAAVISYAMGTQAMIPWDTYVSSTHREWSSVEEVGDLYHFVRQYPYLFDDYQIPAIVGIAMNPVDGTQKTAITTLSRAGLTVKVLPYMTAGQYANYSFTAEDVEGLQYVLELTSLPQDLKQLITDSGAETIQMYPLLGNQDNLRVTWVENGNDDLYNTVRSLNGDIGTATSIHVVNNTNGVAYNTVVGINRDYLPEGNYSVVLYRPLYDPVVLEASSQGRDVTINASESIKLDGSRMKLTVKVSCKLDNCVFYTVDEMNEWSILHIVPEGATEGVGAFDITDGWSSLSLGTGLAEGDVITNNGDSSFTMTTKFLGDNVRTASDRTGSQDMMPFVYKNVSASKLMDYSIEGKVSAFGNSGVMIREYPSANARQVSLYLENGVLMAAVRTVDDQPMFYREIMDVTQDIYLKIVKVSTSFEFYASTDGQNWGEKLISVNMQMDKPLAGVFSFSGDGESVANTVSEVKLTELGIHENEEISDIVIPVEEKYFSEEYSDKLVISATTASGMTLFENDFDTIEYKSSDESIMYVTDNRQIYGVSAGEATLTVTGTIGNYTVTGTANITVSSDGMVYLDENFDVWTPDTLGEGWRIEEAAGGKNNTYIFSANHPSESDNSMGVSDFSTFNATAFYSFGSTPIKRNHTIEFDYYLETELEGKDIANLNTLYISSPLGYMTCLFYERGYFKFYDNTLWHNICEVAPNQWVHVQIDIDFREQTNLFTITDSEGNVYQETYGLRNAGTSVTSLRFTTNTSAQGLIAYYDNLKVYVKGKTE